MDCPGERVSDRSFGHQARRGKTHRPLLLGLCIHEIPRVAYHAQNDLGASQWSRLILDGFNPREWAIDLDESNISTWIVCRGKPTSRNRDSLSGTELHRPSILLDRILSVVANVRLDMSQSSHLVRPVEDAVARGHDGVIVDEPACAHGPGAGLALASIAKKELDNT